MKKVIFSAIVYLLLCVAVPTAKSQIVAACLDDFMSEDLCTNLKHNLQEKQSIIIDVCKKPKEIIGVSNTFKAPVLRFSREASIFNTVVFEVPPYDKVLSGTAVWTLQIDFGDGNGFVSLPNNPAGIRRVVTYPLNTRCSSFLDFWRIYQACLSN